MAMQRIILLRVILLVRKKQEIFLMVLVLISMVLTMAFICLLMIFLAVQIMDCIDTCSHVCMSVFFKQKNKQEKNLV